MSKAKCRTVLDESLDAGMLELLGSSAEDPPSAEDIDRIQKALNRIKALQQNTSAKRARAQLDANAGTAALCVYGLNIDWPIALLIVDYLSPPEKCHAARVSRAFQVLIDSPHAWKVLSIIRKMKVVLFRQLIAKPCFQQLRHISLPALTCSKPLFLETLGQYPIKRINFQYLE